MYIDCPYLLSYIGHDFISAIRICFWCMNLKMRIESPYYKCLNYIINIIDC